RNLYLEEIDRLWIEHLQAMDHLRDGIGLWGYGQRDPKKEYKKEGYDMFLQMMQMMKTSVAAKLFRVERAEEEDLERLEAQRRQNVAAREQRIRTSHPDAEGPGHEGEPTDREAGEGRSPRGGKKSERPQSVSMPQDPVRRERPKLGRNDPCWCGSGKK